MALSGASKPSDTANNSYDLLIALQEADALSGEAKQKKEAIAYSVWTDHKDKPSYGDQLIARYALSIVLRLDPPSYQDDEAVNQYGWLTSSRLFITRIQREAIYIPYPLIPSSGATAGTSFQWLQFSYFPEALMILIRAIKRGKYDVEFWGAITNAIAWGGVNVIVMFCFPGAGFYNALFNLSLFVFDIIHDAWRDQQKIWNAEALERSNNDTSYDEEQKEIIRKCVASAYANRNWNAMVAVGIAVGMFIFFMPYLIPSFTLMSVASLQFAGASLAVIFGTILGGFGFRLYMKSKLIWSECIRLFHSGDRWHQLEVLSELILAGAWIAHGGLFSAAVLATSSPILFLFYLPLSLFLAFISIRAVVSSVKSFIPDSTAKPASIPQEYSKKNFLGQLQLSRESSNALRESSNALNEREELESLDQIGEYCMTHFDEKGARDLLIEMSEAVHEKKGNVFLDRCMNWRPSNSRFFSASGCSNKVTTQGDAETDSIKRASCPR